MRNKDVGASFKDDPFVPLNRTTKSDNHDSGCATSADNLGTGAKQNNDGGGSYGFRHVKQRTQDLMHCSYSVDAVMS